MTTETMNLRASVTDAFSTELRELEGGLRRIAQLEERVNPVEIDIDIDGLDKLEATAAELERIDDADVDVDTGGGVAATPTPDSGGGGREAITGVADGGELETSVERGIRQAFGDISGRDSVLNSRPHMEVERQMRAGGLVPGDVDGLDLNAVLDDGLVNFDARKDSFGFGDGDGMMDSFRESLQKVDLNMGQFYDLIATILPILAVFIGALPSAIAGVAALGGAALAAAGALAALTGLGALGFSLQQSGEWDMSAITDRLKEDFMQAFEPLARDLAPLFREGLNGLSRFFDALAAEGDALRALKDDARALGGFLLRNLPSMITGLVRFGDAASGVLGVIGNALTNMNVLDVLSGIIVDTIGPLSKFVGSVMSLLPLIFDLSLGFMKVAGTLVWLLATLSKAFYWFGSLLDIFVPFVNVTDMAAEGLALLVGVMLIAISVTAAYAKINTLLSGTFIAGLVGSMKTAVVGLYQWIFAEGVAIATTYRLAAALATLTGGLALIGFAVGKATSLANEFNAVDDSIGSATDSLKEFQNLKEGAGGAGTSTVGEGAYINYTDNSTTKVSGSDAESASSAASVANYKNGLSSGQLDMSFS